jgi:hypothetical protein
MRISDARRIKRTTERSNPQKKKAPETEFRKPFSVLSKLRITLPRITVKSLNEARAPFRRLDSFA